MLREKVKVWMLVIFMFVVIIGYNNSSSKKIVATEQNVPFEKEEDKLNERDENDSSGDDISRDETASNLVEEEQEEQISMDSTKGTTDVEVSDKSNTPSSKSTNKNDTVSSTANTNFHIHNFVEHIQIVMHPEEGHYETQVVQGAYDEDVYAWRTLCNKCGKDITDADVITHAAIICESGYHNVYVVVDTIHHDVVTKQVWVVDKYGCTETITTYKCECGDIKVLNKKSVR